MSGGAQPRILIFSRYYLPGVNAGGPVASLANFVEELGEEFRFFIVTPAHDVGSRRIYEGIEPGSWTRVGRAEVLYLERPPSIGRIASLVSSVEPQAIYLNSFFSYPWTTRPLLALRTMRRRRGTIVAPRGELSPGAFELKGWKKRPFTHLSPRLGLYRGVIFHATDEIERTAIRDRLGEGQPIEVAHNLPTIVTDPGAGRRKKRPGCARVVFLSRIHPKKNLHMAIQILSRSKQPIEFTIAGPVEDKPYWRSCQEAISHLPEHVRARYVGVIERDRVSSLLASHDLFFLPTRSENFGHVIYEALVTGTPVLISDQTPWRSLVVRRAGWDIGLDRVDEFVEAIEDVARMDDAEMQSWVNGAAELANEYRRKSGAVEETRHLFQRAIVFTNGTG